jgi:hypothetical protein
MLQRNRDIGDEDVRCKIGLEHYSYRLSPRVKHRPDTSFYRGEKLIVDQFLSLKD